MLLGCSVASAAIAAEQVAIRLGPLQQSVAIADLERFASTGEISPSLRPYAPLLTTEMRQALNSHLALDPHLGEKLVKDLLDSSAGKRLLDTLQIAIPNSNAQQLKDTLIASIQNANGQMSFLSFLKAFPEETITIDGTSAIAMFSQMNLPYWQSQALSSFLERELTVKTITPVPSRLNPSESGDYWVRQQTITFRDYRRNRTIPADIYWSRHTHGPLVVISHGFGADRHFLGYLAQHLASHGLTVVALEHPGSNVTWLAHIATGKAYRERSADILPVNEFIDRPQDVTFLLNELERLSRYSPVLKNKFNTRQVTVIGHSLGGYTALALAGAELDLEHLQHFCQALGSAGLAPAEWLQCTAAELPKTGKFSLQDHRVAQIVTLNPVIGQLFTEASLAKVNVPILMLSGTGDVILPAVSQQLLPFTELTTTKYLITAIGGTHLSIGDPINLNYALTESLFVKELPGHETEALRSLIRAVSLSFIEQLTPNASYYQPFLTPSYAQSFSTPTLKLRLSTDLSANLSNWLQMAALPLEQLASRSLQERTVRSQASSYLSRISDGLTKLPMVMFILPGCVPLLGSQLLKFKPWKEVDSEWFTRFL